MTKSVAFLRSPWISQCLNSAGTRQVIEGSKYGRYCKRVERTVANWRVRALLKGQPLFNLSPTFCHNSMEVQDGQIFWYFKRSRNINFNVNFPNFEMLATNVKHIQVKQNTPGARCSWETNGSYHVIKVLRQGFGDHLSSRKYDEVEGPLELRHLKCYSNPEGPAEDYQLALDINAFYVSSSFLKANLILGSIFPRKRNKKGPPFDIF